MSAAEIYRLMSEAWDRVGSEVMAAGHEFEARLARRRALADAPPPRPFCAVIRANDTRITPMRAAIFPAWAAEKGREAEHRVIVDSRLLKFVTTLVNIPAPGVEVQRASDILGVSRPNIFRLIRDHRGRCAIFRCSAGNAAIRFRWYTRGATLTLAAAGCDSWALSACGTACCGRSPRAFRTGSSSR